MKLKPKKNHASFLALAIISVFLIGIGLIFLAITAPLLRNKKSTYKIQRCTEFAAQLQNKSEKEALDALQLNQSTFRVVSRDGELFSVTEDFNENRVNLYIENGKVSKVGCG